MMFQVVSSLSAIQLACVAGAWMYWAKERTGARDGDTRGVMELPLPSCVSFSRARFFLCHYFLAPAAQATIQFPP